MQENLCLECYEAYNQFDRLPRKLLCNHILCQKCLLEKYQTQKEVICPICCEMCKEDPVTLLVPFFPQQNSTLSRQSSCMTKESLPVSQSFETAECALHQGQFKVLYCKDDREAICMTCAQFSSKHKDHAIEDINDIIQNLKENEID